MVSTLYAESASWLSVKEVVRQKNEDLQLVLTMGGRHESDISKRLGLAPISPLFVHFNGAIHGPFGLSGAGGPKDEGGSQNPTVIAHRGALCGEPDGVTKNASC